MSLYWPEQHVAIEIDDDPYGQPFDREVDPNALIMHLNSEIMNDQDSMIEFARVLAIALGEEPLRVTDEWRAKNLELMRILNTCIY